MNREDIIAMAREAGLAPICGGCDRPGSYAYEEWDEELERFAALVEAAAIEKERKEFAAHAVNIARRAVAEENEACAKVCEDMNSEISPEIAAAIRARMENK